MRKVTIVQLKYSMFSFVSCERHSPIVRESSSAPLGDCCAHVALGSCMQLNPSKSNEQIAPAPVLDNGNYSLYCIFKIPHKEDRFCLCCMLYVFFTEFLEDAIKGIGVT